MARKTPPGWPSEKEQVAAHKRAMAIVDSMTAGKDPAPLRHPLAGPFVRLGQHDPPIALQVGLAPDGKLRCTGLLVGWQVDAIGDATKLPLSERIELTARALRRIRLPEILKDLEPLPEDDAPSSRRRRGATVAGPMPNWLHQTVPPVRHPGPKGHDDEHYRRFAEMYRTALVVAPHSPIKYVVENFPCSEASAHRWKQEARRRGFLPAQATVRRGPPDKPRRKRSR